MITLEAVMFGYALIAVACAWGFVHGIVTDTGKFDTTDLVIVFVAGMLWPLTWLGIIVGKMMRR